MNEKDEIIEEKISNALDELTPPSRLLQPAMNLLLKKKHSRKLKRRITFGLSFLGSFALIFLIIISSSTLINNFNNQVKNGDSGAADSISNNYYYLKDLSKRSTTISEVSQIILDKKLNSNILDSEDNVSTSYTIFYFSQDSSNAFLLIKKKINAPTGLEEAKIIIELTDKSFFDYKNYSKLSETEYDGKTYYSKTYFEDGEYITNSFFRINNVAFYYDFTSPNSISGENYLKEFINDWTKK